MPATATAPYSGPDLLVVVADRAGHETGYELVARPGPEDARRRVTIDSETEQA